MGREQNFGSGAKYWVRSKILGWEQTMSNARAGFLHQSLLWKILAKSSKRRLCLLADWGVNRHDGHVSHVQHDGHV